MSPVPVTATDLNFLNPFSPTVWFCWFLLYCLVSLLCRIASKRAADGDDSLLAFYFYAVPFLKRDQGLWADSRAKLLLISVWSFASVRTLSVLGGYFFASFLLQICSLKLIGAEIYASVGKNVKFYLNRIWNTNFWQEKTRIKSKIEFLAFWKLE